MGSGLVILVLFFLWRAGVALATCGGPIDFNFLFWFVSGVETTRVVF
jgi:hypothetical protein